MSSLKLNLSTQKLLLKGSTYTTKQNIACSSFMFDVFNFCRKLRFNQFFYQNPINQQHESPFIKHISSVSNPPTNFESSFETDMNYLEKLVVEDNVNSVTSHENKIISFLSSQKHVKFTKADKGGCIIIISQKHYDQLALKHLSDEKFYQELLEDKTCVALDKIKKLISSYTNSFLPDESKFLADFKPSCSKFYVLPKIHKSPTLIRYCQNNTQEYLHISEYPDDIPSRPIVNNINCATSRLSYFIDKLIEPYITCVKGYTKDSFHFVDSLPNMISQSSFLINLDVTSLYTIIPHDFGLYAIQYWLKKFPHLLDSRFSVNFVLNSLEIILKNNTFTYKSRYFIQKSGVAMGTIVAPKYAHLTMGYLETLIIERCKNTIGHEKTNSFFNYYWRYLDDIFVISSLSLEDIKTVIGIFNSQHPSFKFTHEIKENESNFLDVKVIIVNNHITTDSHQR